MTHVRFLVAVHLGAAAAVCAGCAGKPWQSPADMARFQKRHYAHLPQLYPAGTARAQVLEATRGRHRATIGLPLEEDAQQAYAGTEIGHDLPIMIDTVRHTTGVEPRLVDVLEFFGGESGVGVEARYVFYDEARRVIAALGSPWAD